MLIKIQNICKEYSIPTRLLDTDIFPQGPETDDITQEQLKQIKDLTAKIYSSHSVLVVIGVGGSYLGAEAFQKATTNYFVDFNKHNVIFAGYNLSGEYLENLI